MKTLFTTLTALAAVFGCTTDHINLDDLTHRTGTTTTVRFQCAVSPNSLSAPQNRAVLTANDKALTDLYIIDYVDGIPVQFLHQVSTQSDFAEPSLTLDYGTHELHFFATRSQQCSLLNSTGGISSLTTGTVVPLASVDFPPALLTMGKVSDSFLGTITLTAGATTSRTQTVALDRIAARMQFVIKDVVPSDAATLVTEMDTHYNAVKFYDFTVSKTAAHHTEIDITSIQGKKDQSVMIYTLAPESAWQSDVHVTVKRSDNTSVSDFTLTDVPLSRNHTTIVSGEYFKRTIAFTFTINDNWDEDLEYNF